MKYFDAFFLQYVLFLFKLYKKMFLVKVYDC